MLSLNKVNALGLPQAHMPGAQSSYMGDFTGLSLTEVASKLGIPAHAIWFFSVAGKRISPEHRLTPGEEMTIHGPVDGGN